MRCIGSLRSLLLCRYWPLSAAGIAAWVARFWCRPVGSKRWGGGGRIECIGSARCGFVRRNPCHPRPSWPRLCSSLTPRPLGVQAAERLGDRLGLGHVPWRWAASSRWPFQVSLSIHRALPQCRSSPWRSLNARFVSKSSFSFCPLPTWWLLRGGCTRSHSEHGRETPQRRWYFVLRRGRVGRCQVCKGQR